MAKVPLESLVAGLEVEDLELDDDFILTEAFVIVRIVRPDESGTWTAYTATQGLLDDSLRIGVLTMVLDRVRERAVQAWPEE